jgi:hypothetical protein
LGFPIGLLFKKTQKMEEIEVEEGVEVARQRKWVKEMKASKYIEVTNVERL